MRSVAALLVLSTLAGCAESVLFRSLPSGATVTVNNLIIGETPVVFSTPSKSLESETFEYRVEADGYKSATGTIPEYVAAGRIVGYVFTVGILRAFRGARSFGSQPVEVALEPLSAPVSASGSSAVEKRLNELKRLRDRGVITDEEYTGARRDVLRDIGR